MFGSLTQANFQSTSAAPTWTSALNAIRNGNAYVNLHTAAHPTGEIRAQLKAAATATPTPTRTPTPKPATPKPTATPTKAPTATVAAASSAVPSVAHRSLPPTATGPGTGRQSGVNLLPVLFVLALGALGGILATVKVKPRTGPKDDDQAA
jgi:hypothetical protein